MAEHAEVKSLHDIPGWFPWIDQAVFGHFLSPAAVVPRGDLVELGAYLGKSAALIGGFKKPDETFTVCDLFGAPPADDPNRRENAKSYPQLDRTAFERNYLSLLSELPVVVQDFSSAIVDHVAAASVRFMHVDASHLYEHVVVDVASAQKLLRPDAVVVFDDFRSEHTPGVSAAVWEAIFTKGLQPICVTPQKLYGTFGDRGPHQERLRTWLAQFGRLWSETQSIAGAAVIRIGPQPAAKAQVKPAHPSKADQDHGLVSGLVTALRRARRKASALRARRVRRPLGQSARTAS